MAHWTGIVVAVCLSSALLCHPTLQSIDKHSGQTHNANSYEDKHSVGAKVATKQLKTIYIGGLFPMNGSTGWVGGQGCLPAAMMALQDVNNDRNILDGYYLDIKWNNSQVWHSYSWLIFLISDCQQNSWLAKNEKIWVQCLANDILLESIRSFDLHLAAKQL